MIMIKNIHILPTDKPSKLCISHKNKLWLTQDDLLYIKDEVWKTYPQNIYITSDEEIKEGDWYLHFGTTQRGEKYSTLCQCHSGTRKLEKASYRPDVLYTDGMFTSDCKKIILTTDQDLIKDGVQAITDEFLKWFVNNSSCKFVEVNHSKIDEARPYMYYLTIPKKELEGSVIKTEEDAKIFIEALENTPKPNKKLKKAFKDFHKQETLEEVAENYGWTIKTNTFSNLVKANELAESAKQDFIAGAKWQQERSYSEEVTRISQECKSYLSFEDEFHEIRWFEQFKKK